MTRIRKCECQNPDPHSKFCDDQGAGLHQFGFFSIEAGEMQLEALIGAGLIAESERNKLIAELEASGLPASEDTTEDNAMGLGSRFIALPDGNKVSIAADQLGYLTPRLIDAYLSFALAKGLLTEKLIGAIRQAIEEMPDKRKVSIAVMAAFQYDPTSWAAFVQQTVAPEIVDRVLIQLEMARAEVSAAAALLDNDRKLAEA